MASEYTKISRSINELKLFLDYNHKSYQDAYRFIRKNQGWHIPYYSSEIYFIVENLEGNLYEGIYPKLLADNPATDDELISSFKGVKEFFIGYQWVFSSIIEKKKEAGEEPYLSSLEGIVEELLLKAIYKLEQVLQLAKEDFLRSKSQNIRETMVNTDYTICIVTAATTEYTILKEKISDLSPLPTNEDDSQIYYRGKIEGKGGKDLNVIITQLHYQGIASSSNTTTKMILSFKPNLVVMLGHAAGNKNLRKTLNVGDILICKEAIDYDSAIIMERGTDEEPEIYFKEKPSPIKADSMIIQSLRDFATTDNNMKTIKEKSKYNELMEGELKFKEGKLISGDALVRSANWFERVTRENHNAIGLDMETYGVYYASCNTLFKNNPIYVSLKSVSDYGGKKDKFTEKIKDPNVRVTYAIETSVNFFLEYAKQNLPII